MKQIYKYVKMLLVFIFLLISILISASVWYHNKMIFLKVESPIPIQLIPYEKVCVRAISRSSSLADVEMSGATISTIVAIVCGKDRDSADRYETRNVALRSIARRRNLVENDVNALMAYIASQKSLLHPAREASLRNDVLNLLRNQEQIPVALPRCLADVIRNEHYDATIIDYAIQHLGALQSDLNDEKQVEYVHKVLFDAASQVGKAYAGTALYALADSRSLTTVEAEQLRRLTCEACSSRANTLVRLSAFQLAGQRGYREILPDVRSILLGDRRDAVADTVAVGTLGLLGDASDIELLESFAIRGGSRLNNPCVLAVEKIKEKLKEFR